MGRELAEDGYSGVEVRVTPTRTEIIIMATRTQNVLGEKGRRIRELTSVVQKRFNFPEGTVELYAEKVQTRGLCAIAQAESLRYKLIGGLAVRRACYGVLRFIMEPDNVSIVEPKEETLPPNPFSETKAVKPDQAWTCCLSSLLCNDQPFSCAV